MARPPRAVAPVSTREGARLIDLTRAAMVTRSRDLDVFSWADPRDVRLVDCGDGLVFACLGALPERRLVLEAVYGFLTLKNGVPIGYVLASALFGSSEVAYNVFETYRGAEAGPIYGRVMAMIHHLFGSTSFTIDPYQLGHGNDEAIESGAWWFYRKFGYVPRDPATVRLMRREQRRLAAQPGSRSPRSVLGRLARHELFYDLGRPRRDVLGALPLGGVGLVVTEFLARGWGAERERAARDCEREAARRLGVRSRTDFSRGERIAWNRWSPLVLVLPGLERWSAAERAALARVIRAKGGRRSEFVRRFDGHPRLRRAIAALARRGEALADARS